jgi:cystathionine beta-lyase/cystathionine gamma-synthase
MPTRETDSLYATETHLIHGEFHSTSWDYTDHIVPPIGASSAYRLRSADRGAEGFGAFANPEFNRQQRAPIYIYDRLDEPTRGMLEQALARAEGAETAIAFTTGMAAISAALGVLVKAGDRVVAHRTIYGCTWSLLSNWMPRFGVETSFIDLLQHDALENSLNDPRVMVVLFETPTNPTLELIDIARVRAAVDRANAKRSKGRRIFIVVDNTFATPWSQRPLSLGADVVCHSLTKNIGGFGTDMGGVVCGPRLLEQDLLLYRKDFGAPLAPRSAWPTLVYGLPTLAVRSRQQIASAMAVAQMLETHPMVERVYYPGLESHPQHAVAKAQMRDPNGEFSPGILLYFIVKGAPAEAKERGRLIMNHLASNALAVTLAVSLGQVRTLVEHPASMTHAVVPVEAQREAGIEPGGIRLSMGVEATADILRDLETALAVVA